MIQEKMEKQLQIIRENPKWFIMLNNMIKD